MEQLVDVVGLGVARGELQQHLQVALAQLRLLQRRQPRAQVEQPRHQLRLHRARRDHLQHQRVQRGERRADAEERDPRRHRLQRRARGLGARGEEIDDGEVDLRARRDQPHTGGAQQRFDLRLHGAVIGEERNRPEGPWDPVRRRD